MPAFAIDPTKSKLDSPDGGVNVRSTAHEFIAALAENEKAKIVTTPHLYDLILTFEMFEVDVGVIVDFVKLLFIVLIW